LPHFTLLEAIGYFNAALGVAMLAMRTMIPLRITGIAHNIVSILFGFFAGVYPMLVQHSILLPINTLRLQQMRRLTRDVKAASEGDHSMEWLKPFTHQITIKAGQTLFSKDEIPDRMYVVITGQLRVRGIEVLLFPGAVVGELGFLVADKRRTQTVECDKDATLLTIEYERLEELYYQNPEFGFYFLRLATARLFDNIGRLEQTVLDREREIARLKRLAHEAV
jgi:CRP-like cAMP-binding protein